MEKKLYIIFITIALISCQSKEEKLVGHWHEFKTNNSEYLNCYHITDSTIGINPLTNGGYGYYKRGLDLEKSEILSLANENYEFASDYTIRGNTLKLNDSVFWIKQTDERKSFLSDFSANLLVNINPPESRSSEFDYMVNDKTIGSYIFIGKLKNNILSRFKQFNKDQYYIQLNDKIAQLEDIIPFLMCYHCDMSKQTILMNVDKKTPKELLNEIESEMLKMNISKNQIYYLTVNTTELTSGYTHSY
jgi:hypothetical protein